MADSPRKSAVARLGLRSGPGRCYAGRMKAEKQPQTPDDIEHVPDAWERFKRAVKVVAKHPPVEHPTGQQPDEPGHSAIQRRVYMRLLSTPGKPVVERI